MTKIQSEELESYMNALSESRHLDDHKEEMDASLSSCRIDVSDTIPEPEVCLEIISKSESTNIATLGNFTAIIGKAKSKKTFLISMAIAAAVKGEPIMEKFKPLLPKGRGRVLFFDTEQSKYHVQKVIRRICRLSELNKPENLDCYGLRPMETEKRIELIEHALDTIPNIGLVVIDGIRDLVMDINDPKESTKIVNKLMQWTDTKGIHIMTVLHQNKGDNNARGHLGTEINNKAETIISVTKDTGDPDMSIVEAEYSRDKEFTPFAFRIGMDGLPSVIHDWIPPKDGKKGISHTNYSKEAHELRLKEVFKRTPSFKYSDLWRAIKIQFSSFGVNISDNKAKDFVTYYKGEGMVVQERERGPYTLPTRQ
jgi:hypothetical protein